MHDNTKQNEQKLQLALALIELYNVATVGMYATFNKDGQQIHSLDINDQLTLEFAEDSSIECQIQAIKGATVLARLKQI